MARASRHASPLLLALGLLLRSHAAAPLDAGRADPLEALLAAEDECRVEGAGVDASCALNALQLRASQQRGLGGLVDLDSAGAREHATAVLQGQRVDAEEEGNSSASARTRGDPKELGSFVKQKGYPFEVHYAPTDDGRLLTLFRLPRPGAKPVHLQHGLMDSAWAWVYPSQDFKAIAFRVYDAGYDVWLGNSRGNEFSLLWSNGNYAGNDIGYWDFSFDDMARHDVPAFTRYVTNHTGVAKLAWVGHSQGTMQMFIAGSLPELRHDVADRISVFIALSPVAWLGNMRAPFIQMLARSYMESLIGPLFPHGRVMQSPSLRQMTSLVCAATFGTLCALSVESVCGTGHMDDPSAVSEEASFFPFGTSFKNLVHFAQGVRTGKFRRYDYGYGAQNVERYGQSTPPDYDLAQYQGPPIAFLAGEQDSLCAVQDVNRLRSTLPKQSIVFDKVYSRFSHVTWMLGTNMTSYYITDILDQLEKHHPLSNASNATG